jgi:flagellar protein FlgJ
MQSASAGGYVDFARFGALRAGAARGGRQALGAVADEFEALFVDVMLKAARNAEIDGGMFDSNAMSTYREMLDHQLAVTLARSQDLGIGRALERDYGKLIDGDGAPAAAAAQATGEQSLRRYAEASRRDVAGGDAPQRGFVERLAPHAERAARRLGVAPRAVLAQAALETGWGEHVMRRADGSSSHNYFGIKAGRDWRGDVVTVPTTEYVAGRAVTVEARFRAYDSPAEAFADYTRLIADSPRYREALAGGADEAHYAHGLARAGYATDPRYAEKIIAIIETGEWPGAAAAPGDLRHEL